MVQAKLKVYTSQNWGFPFIVGFMVLLFIAAVCLSIGQSILVTDVVTAAEIISVIAYFALVTGVLLQLAHFLKNQKNQGALLDRPN
jgi:hypothetical protein